VLYAAIIKLPVFQQRILDSFPIGFGTKDYMELVGKALTEFRNNAFPGILAKEMDVDKHWYNWISVAEDGLNSMRKYGSDSPLGFSEEKLSKLRIRKGSPIHAFAAHYRLQLKLTAEERSAIKAIESGGLGYSFEEKWGPVLRERREDELPPSYPVGIRLDEKHEKGREEFRSVKKALVLDRAEAHAVTVVTYGAGGFGKTAIAEELTLDQKVRHAFPGGIYWLQFGLRDIQQNADQKHPRSLSEAIGNMLVRQYDRETRNAIECEDDAKTLESLIAVLPVYDILIVVDDVWTETQVRWIADLPSHISVFASTRVKRFGYRFDIEFEVARLPPEASIRLLTANAGRLNNVQAARFRKVSEAFSGWPLLINLTNSTIQTRLRNGVKLDSILNDVEEYALLGDVLAWDVAADIGEENEVKRKFVGSCIEAGLDALGDDRCRRALLSMGVFPDDTDVPFDVVAEYWQELTNGQAQTITRLSAKAILDKLNDLSFFRDYNGARECLQIHDVFLAYFRSTFPPTELSKLHECLVGSFEGLCPKSWPSLPSDHRYGWENLLFHLEAIGKFEAANECRTNFDWIEAKLQAVGINQLSRSYRSQFTDYPARKVGRAIGLSVHALGRRPEALAHQIYGRLGHRHDDQVKDIITQAKNNPNFWPAPSGPHLPSIGNELIRLSDQRMSVSCLAVNLSLGWVAIGSLDGKTRIWDVTTGDFLFGPYVDQSGWTTSVDISILGDRIVAASDDETVRIWNVQTGEQICDPLTGHTEPVTCVAFSPDGDCVATGSKDRTTRLWDAHTGELLVDPLTNHEDAITSLAFSPSGDRILIGTEGDESLICDARSGETVVRPLSGHAEGVVCVAFSPSGDRVVTGSDDRSIRIWDSETGNLLNGPLCRHRAGITGVAFNPLGNRIATSSDDKTVREWDAYTGQPIGGPFIGHDHGVTCVAFSSLEDQIITGAHDKTARVWDTKSSDQPIERMIHQIRGVHFHCAAFSVSGERVVTGSEDGIVGIWDAQSGELLSEADLGKEVWIRCVDYCPTGEWVAVASYSDVYVFNTKTGEMAFDPLVSHDGMISCVKFCPFGNLIATGSHDKTVRIWNAKNGKLACAPLVDHASAIYDLAFSPSGELIVTGSHDGSARVWDTDTGNAVCKPLNRHRASRMHIVSCVAFSESGARIVTGSSDNAAYIWNAKTGDLVGTPLVGHDGRVVSATFCPTGERILTGSSDCTARIWDTRSGKLVVGSLSGHEGPTMCVTFSPSGDRVATGSDDNTVRIWDANEGRLLKTIDFDSSVKAIDFRDRSIAVICAVGKPSWFDLN